MERCLVYCCIAVEKVLWMLLSEGGRISNLGQGSEVKVPSSSNNWTMLNILEVYSILVSGLQQGENSEDSNVPLASA